MHSSLTKILGGIAAAVAVLGLAACGTDHDGGDAAVTAEVGNTINYGSTGTTTELDCADGKSLTVGGANNTLTVKGTCSTVNIGGVDNKVTFEKIDKTLAVIGINNTVSYRNGDPKVNNTGTNNTVTKG